MNQSDTHDREEAQAVEIVLALLIGAAAVTLVLIVGWGLSHLDVPVSRVEWPTAGAAGLASVIARLIRVRRAGL